MTRLCTIITAALLASSAFARIGETEQQIEARYGKSKATSRSNGVVSRAYSYRGFSVMASFENGVCRGERYQKTPVPLPLLDADIGALLGVNAGGGKWHQVPDSSADRLVLIIYRGANGRLAMHNSVENTLLITSEDFVARMSSRHAQELKGF